MADIKEVAAWWNQQPCGIMRPAGNRYRVQPHIFPFAEFPKWNGKRVLEIGCGIGEDTQQFFAHGADINAIDISEESLTAAHARIPSVGLFQWNGEEPFPPFYGYYDLVYSFGVIHHTPHPAKILENAWMYLKPKGELRIMLYARYSLKFLLREQPEAQAGCPIVHTYSMEYAKQLVECCGFKVTSITKTHIFPYQIDPYILGRYVKHWYWSLCPDSLFHWLESKLGHHILITAVKP